MNLNNFLSTFFPNDDEQIHFRAIKPKDAPQTNSNFTKVLAFTRQQLNDNENLIELRRLNHLRGLYFVVNAGGNTDAEITRFNAVFVENDSLPIADQHEALDKCPLPPSLRVQTKRSVHAYWLLDESCAEAVWRNLQERLITFFDGDKAVKNPSRLMRLPFFQYLTFNEQATGNYECQLVELTHFNPKRRYSIAELQNTFPQTAINSEKTTVHLQDTPEIQNGSRNTTLLSFAGSLRRKGLAECEILPALRAINQNRVNPPLPEAELMSIAKSVIRYKPEENTFAQNPDEDIKIIAEESLSLPVLTEKALYGLAGEIVRTIEPHTEADNAALLIQLLAGFGCLIGKTTYFRAEADFHYTKLFAILVGASSKGRKGTSFGQIRRLLNRVDESFADCIQDGLSSGEGLIFHVRDAQTKKVPIREKKLIVDYQDEIVDEGAKEKRAFVVEPEFARVLRAMMREGSTLSSVIRQAWDSDSLRVMTKNPIKATEAQISIIGHITKDELARNLDETETANGFANRFLWIFTRRSKYLPEGGNLQESDLNGLIEKLNKAVTYARSTGELKRDEEARQKWIEIYPKLSDGHTGLLGSVTSRAEAQVMRLACLYALLESSEVITLGHLEAALALWQYCEDSARYIFGNQTGNKTADAIYAALLGTEIGLTKTQIRDLFQRNASASQVNSALKMLIELGRIEVIREETDGRPRDIFQARRYDKNDINDKSI